MMMVMMKRMMVMMMKAILTMMEGTKNSPPAIPPDALACRSIGLLLG